MGQLSYNKWERWLEKQQPESIVVEREFKAPIELEKKEVSSYRLTSNFSSLFKMKSPKRQSLNKTSSPLKLQIYPNPCFEKIYIELNKVGLNTIDVSIYNSLGKLTLRRNLQPESRHISMEVGNLVGGTYYIVINTINKVLSKKILVLK